MSKKNHKKKAERTALHTSADLLKSERCPCCKKACPLAQAKCSKGKALRKKLTDKASQAA